MRPIIVHERLSAKPSVVIIPSGVTRLTFVASGPGDVEIRYSINENRTARFLAKGEATTVLIGKAKLSAVPKRISKTVTICRLRKMVRQDDFLISVTAKKVDGSVPPKKSRCLCSYIARKGSRTC